MCETHAECCALSVIACKVQYALCGHGQPGVLWKSWDPDLVLVQVLLHKIQHRSKKRRQKTTQIQVILRYMLYVQMKLRYKFKTNIFSNFKATPCSFSTLKIYFQNYYFHNSLTCNPKHCHSTPSWLGIGPYNLQQALQLTSTKLTCLQMFVMAETSKRPKRTR